MAIRQATTITTPDALPGAHFFLDYIELLAEIFTKMAESAKGQQKLDPSEFHYRVDKSTLCDGITDLQQLGGKHHEFDMGFVSMGVTVGTFGGSSLRAWYLEDAEKWVLYGKVLAIFQQRPRKLRAIYDSLPLWVRIVVAYCFLYLPILVPSLLFKKYGYAVAIYYIVILVTAYKIAFRHSIVELRYAHEATTFRERWKMVQPYILLAAGALAYALAERFVKAIWP
jgi:hypothetical protein